jgi:hypothetical protein
MGMVSTVGLKFKLPAVLLKQLLEIFVHCVGLHYFATNQYPMTDAQASAC